MSDAVTTAVVLRGLAADVAPALGSRDPRAQLRALCSATRAALGAAACSIARVDGDDLVYEAADGAGADAIIGQRLPVGRGIAGFAVRSGQAMIVDELDADDRFARDVASSTGYVPRSLLAAPLVADDGRPLGVLSVLDRGDTGVEPMGFCGRIGSAAVPALIELTVGRPLVTSVLYALADALESLEGAASEADADPTALADAVAERLSAAAAGTASGAGSADGRADRLQAVVASLTGLRSGSPRLAAAAERILAEFVALDRDGRSSRPRLGR